LITYARQDADMISTRTRVLLVMAALVSGVLTGGIVDRALIGASAWRALGVNAWVQYSLHADLGIGLVAYPLEGIGAAILIVAATASFHFDRPPPGRARPLLYLAATFSLCGLLLTLKAAPIMLALASPASVSLPRAFDEFHFWGLFLRGTADFLAFVFEVCAFTALIRPSA
jgi:hypothetical protein